MDPFLGQIIPWPIDWAPVNWALCNGQVLQINQYQALFAVLGNKFGGDGRTTFALPDLRGRIPVGAGTLTPNGSTYNLGTMSGTETTTLTQNNLPSHTHTFVANATGNVALNNLNIGVTTNVGTPAYNNNPPATDLSDVPGAGKCITQGKTDQGDLLQMYTSNPPNITMATTPVIGNVTVGGTASTTVNVSGTTGATGSGQYFDNRQPYVVLNYIIATQGVYPSKP
ncbi:phage tail protein [Clostridium saccharoperbutylacetonicum]|uniref:phage tail protein n=1 Tax=Clostridium saccharoperbutylacetonicum TaxID=36745 RepID=UPI000983C019|nr:tail fiber protein [Clostridium saccharoperbutylacetonicum]AQR94493.1 phage tail collar domain protein [Clostridium saccharoperbutylacetonicum]NSB30329.1 microcystin-dependent protein [Clostridium saccharoperbutylacetonicum]